MNIQTKDALTPNQQAALDIIRKVNADTYNKWFWAATVMAVIERENAPFDPSAQASDGLSRGLMQVRAETAQFLGISGDQLDPEVSIRSGMGWLKYCWNRLGERLGHDPLFSMWFSAYNMGPNASLAALNNHPYGHAVLLLRTEWIERIGKGP